jgi:hypothetical protein
MHFMQKSRVIPLLLIAALALCVVAKFWSFASSEAAKNFAETLAILVGGSWAFYRFIIRREGKPALDIALTSTTIPEPEGRFLAYFDVALTNKSNRQVIARRRKAGQPAFSDQNEVLQHSCSLLLRRVAAGTPLGMQVRWFANANDKSPLATDIVANLLDEYECEVEGNAEFWMEPSEVCHLCVGVILQPGIYLVMITFVGQPSDDREFWRRLFIVQIEERMSPFKSLQATAAAPVSGV